MLHGTRVKHIGRVLVGEMDRLKEPPCHLFSLPQALFQLGLSISYLRDPFFNGLCFIWIAKPALTPFEKLFSRGHIRTRWDCHIRERWEHHTDSYFHSPPSQNLQTLFHCARWISISSKHNQQNSSSDFNMLNVGCWKDWWDRQLKMLAKANISNQQQCISPDCSSFWLHSQSTEGLMTTIAKPATLVQIMGLLPIHKSHTPKAFIYSSPFLWLLSKQSYFNLTHSHCYQIVKSFSIFFLTMTCLFGFFLEHFKTK